VAPGTATPLGLAVVQEIEMPFDRPLAGAVRIDLQVERPAAVPPQEPAAAETQGEESEWER
jgi:hypothetical protein